MIWLEFVGSKPHQGVGIVEDFEHTKFLWDEKNNWKCEVPDILAGMILEEKGVDQFKPCLPPVKEEKPAEAEKPVKDKKDDKRKHKVSGKRRGA